MSILSDLLVGKSEKTSASGSMSGTSQRKPASKQLYSMLLRNLIGQAAAPPDTAISVPQQQAISLLQGMSPTGGSLAARLNAPEPAGGASFLPGAGQAGLQTREQLGLPSRASYNPLGVSLEDLKTIGVPPVQPSSRGRKLEKKIGRVERRADRAEERGNTAAAEKRRAKAERLRLQQ